MNSSHKVRILIILTVLMMAFIFVQSAMPADLSSAESDLLVPFVARIFNVEPDSASMMIRKTAHFTEYLLLGVLLSLTVNELRKKHSGEILNRKAMRILIPWGAGTVYAMTDEVHQAFVPGRSCELRDMGIDSAGTAAGVLIVMLILACRYRKR